MKCIKMKILNILIFLINFITISFSTSDCGNFNSTCPDIYKILNDNHIYQYAADCNVPSLDNTEVTEKNTVERACFVAWNMMIHICNKKLNFTSEYLNTYKKNESLICPFDFIEIPVYKTYALHNSTLNDVKMHLSNNTACRDICYDLGTPEKQCIILYVVNNFIKNSSKTQEVMGAQLLHRNSNTEIETQHLKTGKTINVNFTEEKLNSSICPNHSSQKVEKITHKNIEEKPSSIMYDKINMEKVEKQNKEDLTQEKSTLASRVNNSKIDNKHQNSITGISTLNLENPVSEPILKKEEVQEGSYPLKSDDTDSPEIERSSTAEKKNNPSFQRSSSRNEIYSGKGFFQAEDSHFFFYFLMFSSIIIIGYLAFHNKNKILAYALEGRNNRRNRRRPNSAKYRKLESNLEEAIASNPSHTAAASSVVY